MKYLLILLLITGCTKPINYCTDEIALALNIHLTDQESLSHIQINVGTDKVKYATGTIIIPVEAYEHTYVDTLILDGQNIKEADTIFVDYKVISWVDGSFYFAKRDTLLK